MELNSTLCGSVSSFVKEAFQIQLAYIMQGQGDFDRPFVPLPSLAVVQLVKNPWQLLRSDYKSLKNIVN